MFSFNGTELLNSGQMYKRKVFCLFLFLILKSKYAGCSCPLSEVKALTCFSILVMLSSSK